MSSTHFDSFKSFLFFFSSLHITAFSKFSKIENTKKKKKEITQTAFPFHLTYSLVNEHTYIYIHTMIPIPKSTKRITLNVNETKTPPSLPRMEEYIITQSTESAKTNTSKKTKKTKKGGNVCKLQSSSFSIYIFDFYFRIRSFNDEH